MRRARCEITSKSVVAASRLGACESVTASSVSGCLYMSYVDGWRAEYRAQEWQRRSRTKKEQKGCHQGPGEHKLCYMYSQTLGVSHDFQNKLVREVKFQRICTDVYNAKKQVILFS